MLLHDSPDIKKAGVVIGLATLLLLPMALLLLQPGMNQQVFTQINSVDYGWLTPVWILLTNFGDGFFLYPLAMLLFINSPGKYWVLILTMIIGALLLNGGKELIASARPLAELNEAVRVLGPELRANSMPSGHTGTVFLLAGLVFLYGSKAFSLLVLIFAVLVAISRVVVGAHWPLDLLPGAWLGVVSAVLGSLLGSKVQLSGLGRGLFLVLGLLCVLMLPVYDNGYRDQLYILLTQYALACLTLTLIIWNLIKSCLEGDRFQTMASWCRATFQRFMKFGLVGGSGFVVDLGSYTLITLSGVPHLQARAASYWVAASWNWFWNRNYTFAHVPRQSKLRQWLKYLLMCLFSFVLNWGSYYLLTTYIEFFADYKRLGLVAGVAVGMFFNFTVASSVIFTADNSNNGRTHGSRENSLNPDGFKKGGEI
ncbi:hypothetical protein EOPP23_17730 [Endozoicomonas sp. OPT23]|uniref:GtrA family protein n=1 Tax=Endozoicomonas sp. OPT23 TaxID=2072845 RepID=UPI00129C0E1A|nr:GtrA family protein [Endozoicomonas sp. OPT23]MRI34821.1 hypothetical protein [Endozoicomonas sp. OPT23]